MFAPAIIAGITAAWRPTQEVVVIFSLYEPNPERSTNISFDTMDISVDGKRCSRNDLERRIDGAKQYRRFWLVTPKVHVRLETDRTGTAMGMIFLIRNSSIDGIDDIPIRVPELRLTG